MMKPEETAPSLRCSFCGTAHAQVKTLVQGPGVQICDECVDVCNEIIADERATTLEAAEQGSPTPTAARDASLDAEQCSFCDRRGSEVKYLRPVPNVFVCDECVNNVISS